ncbi:hypothetical protein LCI18_013931 [Fusarium solani-melongenae]|uniref:Uncharacterized protein n=1 Tax=Fusarium solani subsp. cucurbitae TaxID=2747967 RepID=A0ACD3ZQ89_FUSSC|nr:hypothetical protein LCI18_013931 [Fusarium solani-melongenae]
MDYGSQSTITLEYRGRVAILTIDKPQKLNALSRMQYYELAQKLREVATHDKVFVTVILGKGRFFSAGADVGMPRASPSKDNPNLDKEYLQTFVAFNLNICHVFAIHPKILVVGLNGPAVGMSAAIVAHADFIYCTPHTFLLTPFSSLGLVAEGGSSRALVQRLGVAKANEALIMSKRITAQELERCGFVNAIFEMGKGEDERFRDLVLNEVNERLGEHLIGESLTEIKRLIKRPELDAMNQQNVAEVFSGLERFLSGVPQEEFRKIARGEKRHKL